MYDTFKSIYIVIVLIFYFGFLAFLLYLLLASLFKKSKQIRILIINKGISEHYSINGQGTKFTPINIYHVDCRYIDSKNPTKIHTLNCPDSHIYNQLKINKQYTVSVNMSSIEKVHKR